MVKRFCDFNEKDLTWGHLAHLVCSYHVRPPLLRNVLERCLSSCLVGQCYESRELCDGHQRLLASRILFLEKKKQEIKLLASQS